MIKEERRISKTLSSGRKISLSVSFENVDIFTDDEQREATSELETMYRMLSFEFGRAINHPLMPEFKEIISCPIDRNRRTQR